MTLLKSTLLMGTLIISTVGVAGDWTPLLKGMQENCDFSGHEDQIDEFVKNSKAAPKALQADIVKNTTVYQRAEDGKVVTKKYCEQEDNYCFVERKITLKNAQAFGVPIREIISGGGHEYSEFQIAFANNRFEQILPKFWFNDGDRTWHYGDYFAVVRDSRNDRHFDVPYQDVKKYEADRERYDITKSTPTEVQWNDGAFNYFSVDKKKKTIACSRAV